MDANDSKCRHCGSQEFYTKDVSFGGTFNQLLPVGFFGEDAARVRVCGGCGLIQWFATRETLERIKEKFKPESES